MHDSNVYSVVMFIYAHVLSEWKQYYSDDGLMFTILTVLQDNIVLKWFYYVLLYNGM